MTETFIVNTNKHIKMLCTTVILIILICNKIKNYLQKLIHKIVEVFFKLRNLQTNLISRLFIHRAKNKLVKWDANNSYMYQSLTGLQFRKT